MDDDKLLEFLIEIGMNALGELLSIDIAGWDFIVIDDIINPLAKEIIAAYDKDSNFIYINPLIIDIFNEKGLPINLVIPSLMSKIGHEYRHAWQNQNELFKDEFKNWKPISDLSIIDYMLQPIEVDAAAFEECILKALTNNMQMEVDLPHEIIHSEAFEIYHLYGERIKEVFKKYNKILKLNI